MTTNSADNERSARNDGLRSADVTEIEVRGEIPYSVFIGRSLADARINTVFRPDTKKILIIHQPTVRAHAERLREALGANIETFLAEVPDAETAKHVDVAAFCWQVLGQAEFTRSDAIIGLGGGAVTDLAGFVAATWMRGVQCVLVPTSVAGMVDAAIGGKTGINTSEGKNLVGTFTAPRAVIVDVDYARDLPHNEIVAGFAEVVKAGFIYFPDILDLIESDIDRAIDPTTNEFRTLVERAVEMKAQVVSNDFRESGQREFLNYGHTLGHAIEHAERYQWRHGAAVSVGMVFAAELSRIAGSLHESVVDRHRSILERLELPIVYRSDRWEMLLAAMRRDKKARGSLLRFVVLDDVGKPSILVDPELPLLHAAFSEISSS